MGVGGVAWATFLCQGVASVLAAWTLFRRLRGVPAPERHPLFSWRMLGRIARIAVPSILQQSFISVGNPVSYTHLDVYKRQAERRTQRTPSARWERRSS